MLWFWRIDVVVMSFDLGRDRKGVVGTETTFIHSRERG